MDEKPNFRPKVFEPALPGGGSGFGVELEFHERIPGLNGDTVLLYLGVGSTKEQADELVAGLHDLCVKVAVSNPR